MNKKGLTLIELVAIIVLMAVIALIAVPTVNGIIKDSKKKAFENSAYGLVEAGELYYGRKDMLGEFNEEVTFVFPNNISGLDIKGKRPDRGYLRINIDGDIELAISNNKYCALKWYDIDEIVINENIDNCAISDDIKPSNPGGDNPTTPTNKKITNLTLNTSTLSLMKGDTYKMEVTITPSDASNRTLKWTSLDESIATVDSEGNITGISAGETTISVETQDGSNIRKEITVTVRQQAESLELNKTTVSIYPGENDTVTATVLPDNTYLKAIKWTSLDSTIATVEGGVITGVKVGTTTVTAETTDGSNLSKTISVTVKPILVTSITTNPSSVTIDKGTSTTVTATVNPSNASNKNVTWKSNNTSIATVNNGVITGVSSGSTTITVTSVDKNASTTINVTVNKAVNPIITTSNACLKSGTCTNGTKLNIKVNDSENYNFYVINDSNNELTLIMDGNLGGKVAWCSKDYYIAAGGTESDYGSYGNTNKGPLSAIRILENRTQGWTNIPTYNYTYTDDGGGNKYPAITSNNIRARLLTYTEATSLGCASSLRESCPTYLYEDLSLNNQYLLSAAYPSNSFGGLYIGSRGGIYDTNGVNYIDSGIRPVITIPKNQ